MAAALVSAAVLSASAQDDYVPTKENLEAREAFADMRFGVFIHWGIYSMFAQGEWYLNYGPDARNMQRRQVDSILLHSMRANGSVPSRPPVRNTYVSRQDIMTVFRSSIQHTRTMT